MSFFLTAKCRAVSPLADVAFNWSDVWALSNSRHIDWFPASTASNKGILPFWKYFLVRLGYAFFAGIIGSF